MRIAVLAHNLCAAGGLSVGVNVLRALRRVADDHEYVFTLPAGVGYETAEIPTRSALHFHRRSIGGVRQVAFNAVTLPRLIRSARPEVVWGLGNFGLRRPGCPQAILVHDRKLVERPNAWSETGWLWTAYQRYGQWRLRRSLPATQLVFCQTRSMLDRFRAYSGFRGATALMPNGLSADASRGDARQPVQLRSCAGRFLLLCLSRHYPHKNLESLLELFHVHGEELADVTIVTTVDGAQDAAARRFLHATQDCEVRRHFQNVGRVPQSELAGYFRNTAGLILPTLGESFSTTYVEAMHFGRPILTSDRDFAHEICGDAAIYFDPHSTSSMRDAILQLKRDAELSRRLVERGTARLRTFQQSWDEIVRDAVGRVEALVWAAKS